MNEPALRRLLDLVRRELQADDARIELGGRPPEDGRFVWHDLGGGLRLVAVFDAAPPDRQRLADKVALLAGSFADLAGASADRATVLHLPRDLAARRVDDELDALARRTGAARAVVIDAQSPVVWGTSESRRSAEDVDAAIRTARAIEAAEEVGVELAELMDLAPDGVEATLRERGAPEGMVRLLRTEVDRILGESRRTGSDAWKRYLLTTRAIADVRRRALPPGEPFREIVRGDSYGYVARSFATIYFLILVFDGAFSELHAEAAVLHALPVIERLVLALPPIEPPPGGAKVVRFPAAR